MVTIEGLQREAARLEERMAWGEAWTDSGYVFTREDGEPLHPETIGWHFERLVRKAGVQRLRLHDLRHTHATLGLAAGVPPKGCRSARGMHRFRSRSISTPTSCPEWVPTPQQGSAR
jgi:integrase